MWLIRREAVARAARERSEHERESPLKREGLAPTRARSKAGEAT